MNFLTQSNVLFVCQKRELVELLGFETRNKYEIKNHGGTVVGYAAEQHKGVLGFIMRQFLGHWRSFSIHIYDDQRNLIYEAKHPFNWLWHRLEIYSAKDGALVGTIQQRFGILTKKFDFLDANGNEIYNIRSGLFRLWTFPITKNDQEVARIEKKWGGILTEIFLDKDSFKLDFNQITKDSEKAVVLAASILIDLEYFERKAR